MVPKWKFMRDSMAVISWGLLLALLLGAWLRNDSAPSVALEVDPTGRDREVLVEQGGIRLAGTLSLPAGPGPFPAMLLLTGSGAQDRDAEMFGQPRHRVLAEALRRVGVAVLRLDDRGVGGSDGHLSTTTNDDLVADALAALRFLRRQPAIDSEQVGIYGPSQGSMIAPRVAVAFPEEVAFVVLTACIARPMAEVFVTQHVLRAEALGLPEDTVDQIREQVVSVLHIILSAESREAKEARLRPLVEELQRNMSVDPIAGLSPFDGLDRMVASASTPAMADLLRADPRPTLEKLRVPTLVLYGSLDLQVDPEGHRPAAEEALTLAGNPDFEIFVLEGLDHLMQSSETGLPSSSDRLPEAYAPIFLETLTRWVGDRVVLPEAAS